MTTHADHQVAPATDSGATSNRALFDQARAAIPGGVNSPVRAYGSVGGIPRFLTRAQGPHVWDAEGTRYVDLVASWGPAILGHAHPEVVAAVQQTAAQGLSFGASTPNETVLARMIEDRIDPVELVRLVSTGTEATMTAIRLARGFTGRDLLVKFDGHYHGHSDSLLVAAGSGLATLALPGSAGIPESVAATTIVVPYNDTAAIEAVFAEHGDRIAAVITEAAAANMGVVTPDPGFNAFLARTAHAHGALLISDEVLTGFRVSAAGLWGLERTTGDEAPDLFTFGKVVGGGMPLAALGGRADVMNHLAPVGPVYQAGTLSGNPVAVAAGIATLGLTDEAVYRRLDEVADALTGAVATELDRVGVPHAIERVGSLFSVFFGVEQAPRTFEQVSAQQTWRYPAFFHAMLDAGVNLPPSVFEAWFATSAHDDEAVQQVVDALPAAAEAAATAIPPA